MHPQSMVMLTGRQKALLDLLGDGQIHTGPRLGELLGISRAAVAKQIRALNRMGIGIAAVRGLGYRAAYPFRPLRIEAIAAGLRPPSPQLLRSLELWDVLDSTNDYLFSRPLEELQSGMVCIAEMQTAGRGRRGRTWVSPYACNLYLSVCWRFDQAPAHAAGLSLAAGAVVGEALRAGGLHGVGLKWPNDLVWKDRKLGGILVEAKGEQNGAFAAVVGIGLNVCMPASQATAVDQPWVDAKEILGGVWPDRSHLAAQLIDALLPSLALLEQEGPAPFLDRWRALDAHRGRWGTVHLADGSRIQGILDGIDQEGRLLLRRENGAVRVFSAGEVSVRAACGG